MALKLWSIVDIKLLQTALAGILNSIFWNNSFSIMVFLPLWCNRKSINFSIMLIHHKPQISRQVKTFMYLFLISVNNQKNLKSKSTNYSIAILIIFIQLKSFFLINILLAHTFLIRIVFLLVCTHPLFINTVVGVVLTFT